MNAHGQHAARFKAMDEQAHWMIGVAPEVK